tara:strand:+ start:131 stop:841 length:711 start_codon:yes stop_codon:yes gene_type:complete
MNESSYLTLLGKLEHSDSWGFGDAFWLISDYAKHLGQAFNHDQAQWDKTYGSICDIWTFVTNAIREGSIGIKSGELKYFEAGPMLGIYPEVTIGKGKNKKTVNKETNSLVIDRKSFLKWYKQNKGKLIQYLSSAGLNINEEEFLDRLASIKQPSKGGRPEFPYKKQVKQAVEKLLKNKPSIKQGKIPFMPEVVNTFAPNKGENAYPDMSEEEYKKKFGYSISTIKKIVREVYKSDS